MLGSGIYYSAEYNMNEVFNDELIKRLEIAVKDRIRHDVKRDADLAR